jgi:hypothetical protein
MRIFLKGTGIFLILFLFSVGGLCFAESKAGSLTCVGLYSETDAGSISYRTSNDQWAIIKVGDKIPANAEIRINVDRDWIELIPSDNPNKVYEMTGNEKGDVIKKVADILKGKPRMVSFPKVSANIDPKFKDKLVVTQYLGRQRYKPNVDASAKDIKYGDILDIQGNVNIIAINNTLDLMYPNGKVARVIGPIKFDVKKMFTGENLYKYLNIAK